MSHTGSMLTGRRPARTLTIVLALGAMPATYAQTIALERITTVQGCIAHDYLLPALAGNTKEITADALTGWRWSGDCTPGTPISGSGTLEPPFSDPEQGFSLTGTLEQGYWQGPVTFRGWDRVAGQESDSSETVEVQRGCPVTLTCTNPRPLTADAAQIAAATPSDSDADDPGAGKSALDRFEVDNEVLCVEYKLLPDAIGRQWFQVTNVCAFPILLGVSVQVGGRKRPNDGMGVGDPGLAPGEVLKHPYGFIVGQLANGLDEPWNAVVEWACPTKAEVKRRTGADVGGVQWSPSRKACMAILNPEGGAVAN